MAKEDIYKSTIRMVFCQPWNLRTTSYGVTLGVTINITHYLAIYYKVLDDQLYSHVRQNHIIPLSCNNIRLFRHSYPVTPAYCIVS